MEYRSLIDKYPVVIKTFKGFLEDVKCDREKYGEFFLKQVKSPLHGMAHWVRVGIYALAIAEHLRKEGRVARHWENDLASFNQAVLYACFFHDIARDGEGVELEHGKRAERAWKIFVASRQLDYRMASSVSQALLFHVAHPSVDESACDVTICLCNADRLDRARLGEEPIPERMYNDGAWRALAEHSRRLLQEVSISKVLTDLEENLQNL